MNNIQYSPKLKKAMEQIKQIVIDNDIAALVVLQEPGSSEYGIALSPSYSAVKQTDNQMDVDLSPKAYKDENEWKQKMTDTSQMLYVISQTTSRICISLLSLSETIDKKLLAEHFGGTASGHTEQNN